MTEEVQTPPSVPEMLRITSENNAEFLKQIADHIEKLEAEVVSLRARITELETLRGNNTETQ